MRDPLEEPVCWPSSCMCMYREVMRCVCSTFTLQIQNYSSCVVPQVDVWSVTLDLVDSLQEPVFFLRFCPKELSRALAL